MKLAFILLIASAMCGQAQAQQSNNRIEQILAAGVGCFDANTLKAIPCSTILSTPLTWQQRIERLEKAVEKLTTAQPSAYLPSSHITVWDAASRTTRILTLAEANALLVALANAIDDASVQRAAESGNEANTLSHGAKK